ncbi:MAG: MBL fold metallo-hydrolase, partial [Promethearchaeota archaeon]
QGALNAITLARSMQGTKPWFAGEHKMSDSVERLQAIRELYSLTLEKQEVAFVFLGLAGVLVRTPCRSLAFDISDMLSAKEMNEIKETDFLFFTHIHGDHFDKGKAISFYKKTDLHIIASEDVAEKLVEKIPADKLTAAIPGRSTSAVPIEGADILAIRGVHAGHCSQYRFREEGISIFHAGDSGYFGLGKQSANLAFLPTGSPSPWCAPEVALATARYVKPKVAVAMHGTNKQMSRFKDLMTREMSKVEVIIPNRFKLYKVTI